MKKHVLAFSVLPSSIICQENITLLSVYTAAFTFRCAQEELYTLLNPYISVHNCVCSARIGAAKVVLLKRDQQTDREETGQIYPCTHIHNKI